MSVRLLVGSTGPRVDWLKVLLLLAVALCSPAGHCGQVVVEQMQLRSSTAVSVSPAIGVDPGVRAAGAAIERAVGEVTGACGEPVVGAEVASATCAAQVVPGMAYLGPPCARTVLPLPGRAPPSPLAGQRFLDGQGLLLRHCVSRT